MTLGDIVKKYRKENGITMESFAKKSGLSKGYISMLEANENPRSKKPIVPSLDTYRSVSAIIGMDLTELIHLTNEDADFSEDSSGYGSSQTPGGLQKSPLEFRQYTDGAGLSAEKLKELLQEVSPSDAAAIDIAMIPIIGEVAAGRDIVAQEDIQGYYPAPSNIINRSEEYFYLVVEGDSMTPEINDGDLVLVKKQTSVDSGDIGVFLVDKHEGVVKKVIYDKDHIELISANPYYPPRVFNGPDVLRVYVVGKVISSVRRYA